MKKKILLTLMSLFLVVSTPFGAEEHAMAKHVTGTKVEHVEKSGFSASCFHEQENCP